LFSPALLVSATAAHGQSALGGFEPNANGLVRVVIVQPDGKVLLGGDFTTLAPNGGAPVARNRLARLNPDGTLDIAFNPSPTASVYAIALQPDGKILLGGTFTNVAFNNGASSITRNRIARLNPDGSLDMSFDPNANNAVLAIAVQADGKVLAGGDFTNIGGLPRTRMARLDAANGAAELPYEPAANASVWSIVVRPDGKALVGGSFTELGGAARFYIARLNSNATLDNSFNSIANGDVRSIAVQADGSVLVGGQFTVIGGAVGVTRNRIARLDPANGAADSFDPNASSDVRSIAVQPDGRIVVGGFFFTIGGQSRSQIARLNVDGTADAFNPTASSPIHSVAVQADGKILAGGQFITIAGETRNRIARLETDGRLDRTLNLSAVAGNITATAVQPDGKILIGGDFSSVLGVPRNRIARLNTDGTLDTQFDPNANSDVLTIAVQWDGKILLGGSFTTLATNGGAVVARNRIARVFRHGALDAPFDPNANNVVRAITVQGDNGKVLIGGDFTTLSPNGGAAVTRNRIARLERDGPVDMLFNPDANNSVFSIALAPDANATPTAPNYNGLPVVGGDFTSIGGAARNRIARLHQTTGAADSFNPDASSAVRAIAVQADGKILAGGLFFTIGGAARNFLARLDPTTGAADSFNPQPDSVVRSIAVQADGKILAAGQFTSIGGQTRNFIARLDGTAGAADSFHPAANGFVRAVALQADGKILVGGEFTNVGGQTRNRFARLSNDTAALQNLAVVQNAVTWFRGGSSPQFARVTFDVTTNHQNYVFLGHATPSGSNWTVTGLNLATRQNIYVLARGFHGSGHTNGSDSLAESERNAFLAPLVVPSSAVSRKTHGPDPDPLKTFGIDLPLTGTPLGVECRRDTGADMSGPNAGRDHEVLLTFPTAIVSVGAASVTSNVPGDFPTATFSVNGSHVTVYLHNIENARRLMINLTNVSDGTNTNNVSIPMGVLLGDATGNSAVNASDIGQTKARSGQPVDLSSFRTDVTISLSINASDIGQVKSMAGTNLVERSASFAPSLE
jgi:uncharacterized delta-60 repeat protein